MRKPSGLIFGFNGVRNDESAVPSAHEIKKPNTLVFGFMVVGDDGLAALSRFGEPQQP
ncbi:MAG: hypothetical protein IH591_03040 [Bacteroidales bacterium]|nr:hypothetical protein [Bacteroidales bacterium]